MARKSLAAMAVVPIGPGARIQPTDGMTAADRALWDEIVGSVAADHFRPSDRPLLAAYCQQVRLYGTALAQVDASGMTSIGGNGQETVSPHFVAMERSASLMQSLARSLRLSVASRSTPDRAARSTKPNSETKLWQRNNGQYGSAN